MSTKTTSRKSATPAQVEARKAAAKELHENLAAKVAELTSTDEWKRYLDTMKSFRHYSFNNTLLIMVQFPTATRVAGYQQWLKLGRQVRKGAKAIKIFGYSYRKVTEVNPTTGLEETRKVTFFPVLSVFDISQTDGEPLAESTVKSLGTDDTAELFDRTATWLTGQGWTVERGDTFPAEGWTDHQAHLVKISDKLAGADAAAVLLHEAAHVVLHAELVAGEYQAHRGACEVEAEATAYVVAGMLGLDTSNLSVGYVAGWASKGNDLIHTTAENVHRAVRIISDALDPIVEEVAA